MKKLLALLLCVITVFAFVACGNTYDDKDLLDRIARLEQELDDAKADRLKGDKGEQGEKGEKGEQGPAGESGVQQFKIYKLGETFTYINQGIPLFSITVAECDGYADSPYITIKNFNTTNFYPNDYIGMQYLKEGSSLYSDALFSSDGDLVLDMDEEVTLSLEEGLETSQFLYFGTKLASGGILPFAIFEVQPPILYTITYDYQGEKSNDIKTCAVAIDKKYTLTVPPCSDDIEHRFMGWFSEPNGKGVQYTDGKGVSYGVWSIFSDKTVYAYWEDYGTDKKKAPDFTAYTLDGTEVKLLDYYGEKTVFLSVFKTWSDPCTNEMRDYFGRLVEEMGDDVIVLAVSSESASVLQTFMSGKDYKFAVLHDKNNSTVSGGYDAGAYPANYIIDKFGYFYTWNKAVKQTASVNLFAIGSSGSDSAFENCKRYVNNAITRAE